MFDRGFLFSVLLIGSTIAVAGCKPLPSSKPAAEWTAQEARGAAVFQARCARCHYATNTRTLTGPGLQALTKSGAAPSDAQLSATIRNGRMAMPGTRLSQNELEDLIAYLHTL
jgi:mono/diheme cytochrome c family protein